MSAFDRITMRGEKLKQMMDDTLDPGKAWETIHPHYSPPRKYPTPNFLTNPDVNDPRNFRESGGNGQDSESDDFYDYLSEEEEEKKDNPSKEKQHAIDEEYLARVRELEKKRKLDEIREKIKSDAQQNVIKNQINKTRVVDPFPKVDDPLVLQLYLRIYGGYYMNPRDISLMQNADQKLSDMNVFRNSFIQYKDFPRGRTQKTTTEFNSNNPIFNHKAYFPILVRPDLMEQLGKFSFLFEVRDQVTTDNQAIIGFTKLSLNCFFKSLVFKENGYLNTSHFEDAANQYPMVGYDDRADIMDFSGKCVGWLQITMALGSPTQVNFFDRIQQERDKAREEEEEERKRQERRKKRKDQNGDSESSRNKEMEGLLRELIDTIKDKSSSSSNRERGKWEENHMDCLRKLFEECRLDNSKDIKLRVFKDSVEN